MEVYEGCYSGEMSFLARHKKQRNDMRNNLFAFHSKEEEESRSNAHYWRVVTTTLLLQGRRFTLDGGKRGK